MLSVWFLADGHYWQVLSFQPNKAGVHKCNAFGDRIGWFETSYIKDHAVLMEDSEVAAKMREVYALKLRELLDKPHNQTATLSTSEVVRVMDHFLNVPREDVESVMDYSRKIAGIDREHFPPRY